MIDEIIYAYKYIYICIIFLYNDIINVEFKLHFFMKEDDS